MKSTDIAAAIMIAIASTAIAYFLGNAFLGDPNDESVSVSYMDPIAATVAQPDPEVFNNEAINPTVEVFVGNCKDGEVWDPETGSCVTIRAMYEVEITYSDENGQGATDEQSTEDGEEEGTAEDSNKESASTQGD